MVIKDDKKEHSKEARFALEQLAESAKWDEKLGKYSCGLPYKDGREEAALKLNLLACENDDVSLWSSENLNASKDWPSSVEDGPMFNIELER